MIFKLIGSKSGKNNHHRRKLLPDCNSIAAGNLFFPVFRTVVHRIDRFPRQSTAELKRMRNDIRTILAETPVVLRQRNFDRFRPVHSKELLETIRCDRFFPLRRLLFRAVGDDGGTGNTFQNFPQLRPTIHDGFFFQEGIRSAMGTSDWIARLHCFFPPSLSPRRSGLFFGILCFSG